MPYEKYERSLATKVIKEDIEFIIKHGDDAAKVVAKVSGKTVSKNFLKHYSKVTKALKPLLKWSEIPKQAESMGHSWEKPLSLSLLCLSHGITYDEKEKIYLAFNRILDEREYDELDIALFRSAMEENSEVAKDFADIVVSGFVKVYAIELIPELYPFAMVL